jgi:hypothetical protein
MSNAKPIAAIAQTNQAVSVSRPDDIMPDTESPDAAAM